MSFRRQTTGCRSDSSNERIFLSFPIRKDTLTYVSICMADDAICCETLNAHSDINVPNGKQSKLNKKYFVEGEFWQFRRL